MSSFLDQKKAEKAEITEPIKAEGTKLKWNKSWMYAGPQHIPEEVKNPRFTYGWISYKTPGRIQAALFARWEIDVEVLKKLGKEYNLPTMNHGTPVEGALCVGQSMLVRRPKEIHEAMNKLEQDSIVEPEKLAKKNLAAALGGNIAVSGEVVSKTL